MFKELAPLLRQRSVLLSLTRLEDDTIRVNIFPKKLADGENEALTTPLSVTGTAEELDTQFPFALTEYVGLNDPAFSARSGTAVTLRRSFYGLALQVLARWFQDPNRVPRPSIHL
jgi:hypothetical protein